MDLRVWQEGETGLEVAAKASAALGAAALATAFLFDGVYFWRMDARLLGTFVFADHVETAVYCIPLLLMFAVLLLVFPMFALLLRAAHDGIERKFGPGSPRITAIAIALSFCVIVAWYYLVSKHPVAPAPPPEPRSPANLLFIYIVLAMGMLVGASVLWMFLARDSSLRAGTRRLTWLAPVVWIASTVLFAIGAADENVRDLNSAKATVEDVVTLQDYTQLAGRLIKVVDKGAIVGVRGQATFAYRKNGSPAWILA